MTLHAKPPLINCCVDEKRVRQCDNRPTLFPICLEKETEDLHPLVKYIPMKLCQMTPAKFSRFQFTETAH